MSSATPKVNPRGRKVASPSNNQSWRSKTAPFQWALRADISSDTAMRLLTALGVFELQG
jgi:hypothetical protein